MSRFNWRHQYDQARDREEGDAAATLIEGPSLTVISFKDDTDINVMMKRFGVTDGAIPPAVEDPRYYGDFSDVPDFRQALDATRDAEIRFGQLPASIRSRFGNSPLQLWQFVTDPNNAEEAVTLGLLHKKVLTPPPETSPQTPQD